MGNSKVKNADVIYQKYVPLLHLQLCSTNLYGLRKNEKKMVGTCEKVISADKAYQYLIVANEIAFSMPKGKHTRIYTLQSGYRRL